MDALSIEGGAANHFGVSGGLKPEFVEASIAVVKKYFKLQAGAVASLDPTCGSYGRFVDVDCKSTLLPAFNSRLLSIVYL
jgi:hypothetical protein